MHDELVEAVIFGNISKVETLLNNGADISAVSIESNDGRRPAIEFASFNNNFELLFILWKAKALPTTPFLEVIFENFSKGKSPLDLKNEFNKSQEEYVPINGNFSVEKMPFEKAGFYEADGINHLVLRFSNFQFKDQKVIPLLEFKINKQIDHAGNIDLFFARDECSSSLYFFECHNPVDLLRLQFNTQHTNSRIVQIHLFFDFEFENTGLKNQTLHITTSIG